MSGKEAATADDNRGDPRTIRPPRAAPDIPSAPFASDDYLKYDFDGQIRIAVPGTWKTGDQKSLAVEWAPVGANKCLVARVEILMGEKEPKMTSFLVEDLDEVLELSD